MTALFAKAFEKGLEAKRKILHVRQDESGSIILKGRNQTTGALDVVVATISESWSKRRTKLALGGFVEMFHVAEAKLTDSQAEATAMVTHGTKNYKVQLSAKPSGVQRYYVFEIQPV